jgi:hypothetical protein
MSMQISSSGKSVISHCKSLVAIFGVTIQIIEYFEQIDFCSPISLDIANARTICGNSTEPGVLNL